MIFLSDYYAFQVNDIRRAMEISPTKGKEISILRKSNQPLILKKNTSLLVNANVQDMLVIKNLPTPEISAKSTGIRLTSNPSTAAPVKTQPVIISSTSPPTLNYRTRKIKVLPSSTNSKDTSFSVLAIKLKSAEVYAAMLTEPKLAHFFKCMDCNCSYTTDSVTAYSQHYLQHEEASKQNSTLSHNYQKCAYCYTSLNDWASLKTHLWEKHSHCRYQCGYCFYRAVIPSYIQQHQVILFSAIILSQKRRGIFS